MSRSRKRRQNFRREHHDAYLIWRQRMRFAQAVIREVPDERYIELVRQGRWRSKRNGGWPDPVRLDFRGINTVEGVVAFRDEMRPADVSALHELEARSLFEVERFEFRWHADGQRDPADAWAEAIDRRQTKLNLVLDALFTGRVRDRYRRLDVALDACSIDGDPEFAAGLVDLVRGLNPGYALHCWQKREHMSRRGRKRKAAVTFISSGTYIV